LCSLLKELCEKDSEYLDFVDESRFYLEIDRKFFQKLSFTLDQLLSKIALEPDLWKFTHDLSDIWWLRNQTALYNHMWQHHSANAKWKYWSNKGVTSHLLVCLHHFEISSWSGLFVPEDILSSFWIGWTLYSDI
jgi:hypothetical protein